MLFLVNLKILQKSANVAVWHFYSSGEKFLVIDFLLISSNSTPAPTSLSFAEKAEEKALAYHSVD